MTSYTSMQTFQSRCEWSLPGCDSEVIPGSIGFDGEKIVATMSHWIGEDDHPIPVLHGAILDGMDSRHFLKQYSKLLPHTPFTAFHVFPARRHQAECGLHIDQLAVGRCLAGQDSQLYPSMRSRVLGLGEWWGRINFDVQHDVPNDLQLRSLKPSAIISRIDAGSFDVRIIQSASYDCFDIRGRRAVIEYDYFVELVPDEPQLLGWFSDRMTGICHLLSLFMDQSVPRLDLQSGRGSEREEWFYEPINKSREFDDRQILVRYSDIQNDLNSCLNFWLQPSEKHEMARLLLFNSHASPAPFMEQRFLSAIQAIEVYDSSREKQKHVPASDYRRIKKAVLDAVPHDAPIDLKAKLASYVGLANDFSLRDRVKSMATALEPAVRAFVCGDPEVFAKWLAITRNYYTHYGEMTAPHLRSLDLHHATVQAALLLKLTMLTDCGVPESLLLAGLSKSWTRQQGKTIWSDREKALAGIS